MKKFYLFLFMLYAHCAFAQHYYIYKGQRIIFKPDTLTSLISYSSNFSDAAINHDSIMRLDPTNKVQRLRTNQFILSGHAKSVSTLRNTYKKAYISKSYIDENKNMTFFLPRLMLKLKEGGSEQPLLNEFKGQLTLESNKDGIYKLNAAVNTSDELLSLIDKIYNSASFRSDIEWCEPEFYTSVKFHDDPLYGQQTNLKNTGQTGGTAGMDINIEPAWNITKGSTEIKIALVDEGVEAHEDLGTLLTGYTVGGGTGAPQNANMLDVKGHGEACAGILAALHNDIGVKGIAPNCKIVPVNIAPNFPFIDAQTNQLVVLADNADIALALNFAWHNADVISCSWGGGLPSAVIGTEIDNARTQGRNSKGCPVVFSSGNSGGAVAFPGNYNGVITVGAVDKNGTIFNYSSRGPEMDLVTPSGDGSAGGFITIDRMNANGYNNGNYMTDFSGTSASCPQVSAVAALLLSINPGLTEAQVKTALQTTARDLGTTGFDNTYGYGLLNAASAMNAVLPVVSGPSPICNTSGIFTVSNLPAGASVVWSASPAASVTLTQSAGQATVTKVGSGTVTIIAQISLTGVTYNVTKSVTLPSYAGPGHIAMDPANNSCMSYNSTRFITALGNSNQPVCNDPNVTEIQWQVMDLSNNTQITNYQTQNCGSVIRSTIGISLHSNPSPYVIQIIARAKDVCGNFGLWGPGTAYQIKPTCSSFAFSISPNPTTSIVNIQPLASYNTKTAALNTSGNSSTLNVMKVNVFSSSGKLMRSGNFNGTSSNVQLNVSGLPSGVYYLEITTKDYSEKQTLLIN